VKVLGGGEMFTRLYRFGTVTTRYFRRRATSACSDRDTIPGPRTRASPRSLGRRCSKGAGRPCTAMATRPAISPFVANVVDGVPCACEAPNAAGEVMNVACGTRVLLNQLVAVMNGLVGTNLRPIYKPARAGDVRDSQADICEGVRCPATGSSFLLKKVCGARSSGAARSRDDPRSCEGNRPVLRGRPGRLGL
jgi:nucleoside-diphosphate-sugar epimerase